MGDATATDGTARRRQGMTRQVVSNRRRRRTVVPITLDELMPEPREVVRRGMPVPDTIAGWKALAEGLLTDQACVFHRNLEISSRYAWIYKHLPACKWAGMAAFASHHVRARARPVPAGHRPHRPRRHPAQLASPAPAADGGRGHDPHDEQRHLRRHLLGAPRVRLRRGRDRTPTWPAGSVGCVRPRARRLRDDRPRPSHALGHDSVVEGSTGGRRPRLGGQRPTPRARAARPGATPLRSPLVPVRQAALARLGPELRGPRVRQELSYFSSFYLYSFGRGIPDVLRAQA